MSNVGSAVDTTRVQIAKGRVSPEIAALIHNHQTLHKCNSWGSLKELLNSHFNKEVNFDRAWQNINSEGYDWSESPQAFVNNFICRYAILETQFTREKLPNRDKIIKRKLWQGLPQEPKTRLEGFLDEDYPLDKFVDRVEQERQWLEANHTPMLGRIIIERKSYPLKTDTQPEHHKASPNDLSQPNATPRESLEVNEIKKPDQGLDRTNWEITNFPRSTPQGVLLLTLPFSFS